MGALSWMEDRARAPQIGRRVLYVRMEAETLRKRERGSRLTGPELSEAANGESRGAKRRAGETRSPQTTYHLPPDVRNLASPTCSGPLAEMREQRLHRVPSSDPSAD